MTFRLRFLLLGGGALLLVLGASGSLLWLAHAPPSFDESRGRLERQLSVAVELVAGWEDPIPEAVADRLAELLDLRVTLVATDGQVLGESHLPTSDSRNRQDRGDRPEVVEALQGGVGFADRSSASLGQQMLYAAVVAEIAGQPVVLRVATPSPRATGALQRYLGFLALAGLGGLFVLGVGGRALSRGWTRPLGSLAQKARAMGDGRFERGPSRGEVPPELGELAGALHDMAEQLEDRVHELEGQRNELQALIDSIAEGVLALTEDARVLRMNAAAGELLEISRPAPFAPIGTLVRHPDLRDHLEESVLLPLAPREIRLGDRHLLISSHLMPEGGSVVTFLDVTRLRQMEQVRRDFVANASHELKTPLTSMRGFAETLLEGDPPEHLRAEFLRSIRNNTVRLQNLVDDLLDLSRLESGGWTAAEEEVSVSESAWEAWEEVVEERSPRDVDFDVEGDQVALADRQALHQIFRNLIDNALRYTPGGGSIRIRITADGPHVRVGVSDTGAGIPSSALPRIFERFFRVDSGRDRTAGGTGLGLAIVRHLVQSMGGEVSAASQLGEGTTIHFSVPRVGVSATRGPRRGGTSLRSGG